MFQCFPRGQLLAWRSTTTTTSTTRVRQPGRAIKAVDIHFTPSLSLSLLPPPRYCSASVSTAAAAATPKANLSLAQQSPLPTECCRSDRSQASELRQADLMFHVRLARRCCCCTLLHNAPLFFESPGTDMSNASGGEKKEGKGGKKEIQPFSSFQAQ